MQDQNTKFEKYLFKIPNLKIVKVKILIEKKYLVQIPNLKKYLFEISNLKSICLKFQICKILGQNSIFEKYLFKIPDLKNCWLKF